MDGLGKLVGFRKHRIEMGALGAQPEGVWKSHPVSMCPHSPPPSHPRPTRTVEAAERGGPYQCPGAAGAKRHGRGVFNNRRSFSRSSGGRRLRPRRGRAGSRRLLSWARAQRPSPRVPTGSSLCICAPISSWRTPVTLDPGHPWDSSHLQRNTLLPNKVTFTGPGGQNSLIFGGA